jgi:hypothetical protein
VEWENKMVDNICHNGLLNITQFITLSSTDIDSFYIFFAIAIQL